MFIRLLLILSLILLHACVDSGGRAGKGDIQNYSEIDRSGDGYCTGFTEISINSCLNECANDFHIGTDTEIQAEIDAYVTEYANNDLDAEQSIRSEFVTIIQYAAGICIQTPASRPTDDIFINPKFCACQDSKPFIVNDCETFCAGISDTTPTLYVSTIPGTSIITNQELVDTKGWCSNDLTESTSNHAPSCSLQIFDGINTSPLELIWTGNNSFKVDLSSIQKNKTYIATIVENESGAKSKSFQIYAIDSSGDSEDNSPLKIMPISQYTCVYLIPDSNGANQVTHNSTDFFSQQYSRRYYYYPSNKLPHAMSGINKQLICHDPNRYGQTDSVLYPRLELISDPLALWDQSDTRFYDSDNNGKIEINEQIQRRLLNEYSISSTINIFQPFVYASYPEAKSATKPSEVQNKNILQGYYMQPWIDEDSKLGYCPKQEQYLGNIPVFRILKEIIGTDTEAVYFAKGPDRSYLDSTGASIIIPASIIIIRENVLKKIWFYYENAQHLWPNEIIAGQKDIMFYYPPAPNFEGPHTKKSYQQLFTVYNPTEDNQTSGDPRTDILPPNKMFGCIPSLGNTPYTQ